jgi:hypothetical protein
MQRVYDSWRATMGSTAIAIVNSVYENSNDELPTDDDHQEYAEQQLDDLEFLYGDTDSKV